MKNFSDVPATAVVGGLWHAQSGTGSPRLRPLGLGSFAPMSPCNDALRPANGAYPSTVTPAIAVMATAKQAPPQSRRSSAHP